MNLNAYLAPALYLAGTACALTGLVLAGGIYLFLWVKRRLRPLEAELTLDPLIPQGLSELRSELQQLNSRLDELEQRKSPLLEWVPEPSSVNLNRRGQVLRLHRRGDSVAQIAATLGLSQGEVELMVKVQEMAVTAPAKENAAKNL